MFTLSCYGNMLTIFSTFSFSNKVKQHLCCVYIAEHSYRTADSTMTVAMMSSSLVLVVVLVTATLTAEARSSSDPTCYSDCRGSSSSSKSNHHSKCSPASATVGFAILAIQNVRAFCVDEQVTCSCYNSIYVFTEHVATVGLIIFGRPVGVE